jgi:hypothetical protein
MSRREKIASSILVTFLVIELLAVIVFLAFGPEPLIVLLEDAGLIVIALPAVSAVLLIAYLHRLASIQIDKR